MAASGAEFFMMNEVNRPGNIQRVHDHTLLQREAALLPEITVRQVLRRYREHSAALFVSERRRPASDNASRS